MSLDLAWNRRRLAWGVAGQAGAADRGAPGALLYRGTGSTSRQSAKAFWSAAQRKLGKLRRLSQRDRWQIETLLAARIPKPELTPSASLRPSANPVRGPHQPLSLRTR
jgi:hypothetical protein